MTEGYGLGGAPAGMLIGVWLTKVAASAGVKPLMTIPPSANSARRSSPLQAHDKPRLVFTNLGKATHTVSVFRNKAVLRCSFYSHCSESPRENPLLRSIPEPRLIGQESGATGDTTPGSGSESRSQASLPPPISTVHEGLS